MGMDVKGNKKVSYSFSAKKKKDGSPMKRRPDERGKGGTREGEKSEQGTADRKIYGKGGGSF